MHAYISSALSSAAAPSTSLQQDITGRTFRFGDSNEMRRSVADADSIGPVPSGSNVAERAKMFKRHVSIYSTEDGGHDM